MNGKPTFPGRGLRRLAAVSVASLAILAATAAGSAQASPGANPAENRCSHAAGAFTWGANQYTCTGNDGSLTFSFMDAAERQCTNTYKGWEFDKFRDFVTGDWSYTCKF